MTLEEILGNMRALEGNGDPEDAHGDADDLLMDTINALAEKTGDQETATAIINSFCRVEKWYA